MSRRSIHLSSQQDPALGDKISLGNIIQISEQINFLKTTGKLFSLDTVLPRKLLLLIYK